MLVKIPTTMATQHPDNASAPFWLDGAFISTQDEIQEIYENFAHLGVDEYMWDWEGKVVDEAIFEKLFAKYLDFLSEKQIGKHLFITLRIPNIWEEKTFKLPRSYISVLSAADLSNSLKLHSPPVFEMILPMTKKADQLIHIQETFRKTSELYQQIFSDIKNPFKDNKINIISLFESVEDLTHCADVLKSYIELYQEKYGKKPPYLRSFIARSDPALNAGFVPAVLASRMATREFYRLSNDLKIPIYPIIGTGSLPFRGWMNPEHIDEILEQYSGIKTFTVQSAFRYDYDIKKVKTALTKIQKSAKNPLPLEFNQEEFEKLKVINDIFSKPYRQIIEKAAGLINEMAKAIPRRRERVLHTGLFGYNRGVGKTKLPRAITFTAAWYSLGIPPEFIGLGQGLQTAKEKGLLSLLEKHFFTLRSQVQFAGKYLNFENIENLAKKHSWAQTVLKDIELTSKILKIKLGPEIEEDFIHRNLTSTIFWKHQLGTDFSKELVEAAIIRKSLG